MNYNLQTDVEPYSTYVIPTSIQFNYWLNLSRERNIEALYKRTRNVLYSNRLKEKWITEDYVEKKMQKFNMAYWSVKQLFQEIDRNNWNRYFDHIIWVLNLILEESENPTMLKVLISLNHDIMEDTDISFQWLKEYYWEKVALWVLLISKKPFVNYIENEDDLLIFHKIRSSWILNDKWLLSDKFLRTKKYVPHKLDEEELNQEKEYRKIEKKYKEKRNEDYFFHMVDFEIFYNNALELRTKYNIDLNNEEIRELCIETLEVKYFDRIDNLKTSEIYLKDNENNRKKSYKKIEETKKYFYQISEEINPNINKIIIEEVEKLEEYLKSLPNNIISETRETIAWIF